VTDRGFNSVKYGTAWGYDLFAGLHELTGQRSFFPAPNEYCVGRAVNHNRDKVQFGDKVGHTVQVKLSVGVTSYSKSP